MKSIIRIKANGVETIDIDEEETEIFSDFYVGFNGYASSSTISDENPYLGGVFLTLGTSGVCYQSFTASTNGLVDKIFIYLSPLETSYDFAIYEGSGTSGQLLGSITLSNPTSYSNTLDFSSQNIVLEKDQVYSLGSSSQKGFGVYVNDPYTEGVFSVDPDYDLIFSLYLFKAEYGLSVEDGVVSSNGIDIAPIGTIQMWPTSTPPTGWLICDGSTSVIISHITSIRVFLITNSKKQLTTSVHHIQITIL